MNFNKVVLVGRLVANPELRHTTNGTAVSDITVAVNDRVGKDREEVSFVDCTLWGLTAENTSKYLGRGSLVLVEGRLHQDKWQTKEGENRSKLKVMVERLVFMEGKKNGNENANRDEPTEASNDNENSEDIPF